MSALRQTHAVPTVSRLNNNEPWLTAKDIALGGKWLSAWLLASTIPSRAWDTLARHAVALAGPALISAYAKATIDRFLTNQPVQSSLTDIGPQWAAQHRMDQLAVMRCHSPWPWRPNLELDGLEHIERAQSAGRGCLLWVAPTVFGSVLGKRTLFQHGLAIHHLSRDGHGTTSRSRFGRRYMAQPRCRLEDQYLAERVRIPERGTTRPAMDRIKELLCQQKIVSIVLGANAQRTARATFLNDGIVASSGVPYLARNCGATLHSVVTIRLSCDHFRTFIGPAIDPDQQSAHADLGGHAVAQMARRIEPFALKWPEQINWDYDIFAPNCPPS